MPVVRVSDQNFKRLQRWAIPLQDTVDDALSRVLTVAERYEAPNILSITPSNLPEQQDTMVSQLVQWLDSNSEIRREKDSKTMLTYRIPGLSTGLFVSTNGTRRVYLPRISEGYAGADPQQKVEYRNGSSGWDYYPQFVLKKDSDVVYAEHLIEHATKKGGNQT